MEIFFEIHSNLPREAPGSDACTLQALAQAPLLPAHPQILDIGCGPGAQSLVLARQTGGHVIAIDTHQPFLDELTRRAEEASLADHITARNRSMFDLDFEPNQFDLIWSEGAIYIMGFEDGLTAWRRLLKPGGVLAVTEVSWLMDNPPDEPRRFWEAAYPAIQTIPANIGVLQDAGYRYVHHFALPEAAWWDTYYTPIEQRMATLRQKHQGNPDALAVLDQEQQEIELYRAYPDAYGYVFYIMQRPEEDE